MGKDRRAGGRPCRDEDIHWIHVCCPEPGKSKHFEVTSALSDTLSTVTVKRTRKKLKFVKLRENANTINVNTFCS